MSSLGPLRSNSTPGVPTPPRGDTIARFGTYLEAQKAVDYLSDNHFPVRAVTIVGVDLKMVERVTGRMTYTRAAMAGLASGAWFGLFVGLLISVFGDAEGFSVFYSVFIGAAFGLLFMVMSYGISHAVTGGARDFTSTSQIVAGEYLVLCLTEQAPRATAMLRQLAQEGGPASRSGPAGPAAGGGSNWGSGRQGPSGTPGPGAGGSGWHAGPQGPPPGPSPEAPVAPAPGGQPASPPAPGAPVTGPTYSEMIDRKRAEERAQAEREAAERAAAERAQDNPDT